MKLKEASAAALIAEQGVSATVRVVVDTILARIRSEDYAADERLPSERTLASELGVARNTVREALDVLEGSGVIRRRAGSGSFVTGEREGDDPGSGDVAAETSPLDLQVMVDNVSFDPYNTGYGFKGANALGYYARFDPQTGDHLGGQFLLARKANNNEDPAAAEANAAVPEQATALADGTMVIVGSSAYLLAGHDKKSVGGVKVGSYTAYEPFVLLVAPDFGAQTLRGWLDMQGDIEPSERELIDSEEIDVG